MSCTVTMSTTETKTSTSVAQPEVRSASASSLISRAVDIVPEVAAATGGVDVGITFFQPFSQYCDALLTASQHEKSWAASQLEEEWRQSGLDEVVGSSAPRIIRAWAGKNGSSQSDGVRNEVKDAISKARKAMSSFKGTSIDDEILKVRVNNLLEDACSFALSDDEIFSPNTHIEVRAT
ncbi:hypothetical protein IAR50_002443 [Cryptococcus sp. DSM 104548]